MPIDMLVIMFLLYYFYYGLDAEMLVLPTIPL